MLAIALGMVAGLAHAATGPDHLAAVSALSADGRRSAWSVGLRWGLGHSLGVVLIAALAVSLQRAWGIDAATGWSERAVGALMVLLGLWALRRGLARRVHAHPHTHAHGDAVHEHVHVHVHLGLAPSGPAAHLHGHAPYAIGALHGFGGGAHLLGVAPALAFVTSADAAWYLAGFAAGSTAAMTGFAAAVGAVATRGSAQRQRAVAVSCALASCAVGGWWMLA